MNSEYQVIADGKSIRVDTESVEFYLPVDDVDEKDLSKNRYSIAFVVKSKHQVLWTYRSRDERDAMLKRLDTDVFHVTDMAKVPVTPEVV